MDSNLLSGVTAEDVARQGRAAEAQRRATQRKYYDAILEVLVRDPLMWEAMYKRVVGKEIDYAMVSAPYDKN